jgi:hypothetical protein
VRTAPIVAPVIAALKQQSAVSTMRRVARRTLLAAAKLADAVLNNSIAARIVALQIAQAPMGGGPLGIAPLFLGSGIFGISDLLLDSGFGDEENPGQFCHSAGPAPQSCQLHSFIRRIECEEVLR